MARTPGISIIIPTFNTGRYIRETVASVYAQKLPFPFEVVIVDDGSCDGETPGVLSRLPSIYPGVKIICHPENLGVSAARNTALRHAIHPYIFPLDSDDMLSTDPRLNSRGSYLERAVNILHAHDNVVFTRCRLQNFGAAKRSYEFQAPYNEKVHLIFPSGPYIVYRREEALAIGAYNTDLRNGEDSDLAMALINERFKNNKETEVHQFSESFLLYRKRQDRSSLTDRPQNSRRDAWKMIVSRIPEIYQKYYPGLDGEKLAERIMQDYMTERGRFKRNFTLYCLNNLSDAFHTGALQFVAEGVTQRLCNTWKKVARFPVVDNSEKAQPELSKGPR
jgi:glycosyltransferase involved in cell wall biosynthesis